MTQCVVFSTPGLIPIEAFTVFGMNAKPNSKNPFGFFGTGLKIAIAVCLRMDQEVVIWRGKDKYTFYTKKEDFRGKEFRKIRMKRETWHVGDIFRKSYHELPFTTELGKHWELWQAFREFQTNTMDENGSTYLGDHQEVYALQRALEDNTCITVTGSKFVDEFHDRARNFLPDGLTVREGDESLQVIDRPSKHVYYRGVRVWDLKEEAQYTYNFLRTIDLTEDRTAKYPFLLESWICEHIMQSEDESFLEKTVSNPLSGRWERSLSYNYTSVTPSSSFRSAAVRSPNVKAKEVVKVAETAKSTTRLLITIPKPTIEDEELYQLTERVQALWGADTTVIEEQ